MKLHSELTLHGTTVTVHLAGDDQLLVSVTDAKTTSYLLPVYELAYDDPLVVAELAAPDGTLDLVLLDGRGYLYAEPAHKA